MNITCIYIYIYIYAYILAPAGGARRGGGRHALQADVHGRGRDQTINIHTQHKQTLKHQK